VGLTGHRRQRPLDPPHLELVYRGPGKKPLSSPEILKDLRRNVHQTLRKVTHNFENFEFNTIISSLMELMNNMYKAREAGAAGALNGGRHRKSI